MHALINNGAVEKYPYTIGNLRRDNPHTSFPKRPSDETLEDWNVYVVTRVDRPEADPITQNIDELTPVLVDGQWTQMWAVWPASPEEIAERKAQKNESIKQGRFEEYTGYSDPLFFKWQRGEGTKEEWLEAVEQIKELLPYVD
jgi:hypothetical protein